MVAGGAPLFGLRWVPDSQLRPLRYLPNPHASPAGSDWWMPQATPRTGGSLGSSARETEETRERPVQSPPSSVEVESDGVKLRQSVRALTQRLAEAQDSVRQKVEQIRWLKEMTKDDASRARVARWMRGPLLRVFVAWKRVVADTTRRALSDLQSEFASSTTRHRELQARCDDLSREHAMLQAAIEHYFKAAGAARSKRQLEASWRRWAPLRLNVSSGRGVLRGLSVGLPVGVRVGGLIARRAVAVRRALLALKVHAQRSLLVEALRGRSRRRHAQRALRRAMDRLISANQTLWLDDVAHGDAAVAMRLRAAWHTLRRECGRLGHVRALEEVLAPHALRRGVRFFWCRWTAEAVRRLGAQHKLESSRAARAQEELAQQQGLRATAEEEARTLRAATSLWSDDELPAMLSNLAAASKTAGEAAAEAGESGAVMRRDAAVAAAGWQGTQLRLTLATLDSLKKELARERAALSSARSEARASDAVAEQALTMLQTLREESASLQTRLASLEEVKLRTEQALVRRDAELFDVGRAQHAAARALGLAMASVEEKTFAQLQRIDAKLQVSDSKLQRMHSRVSRVSERAADARIDSWARALLPGGGAPSPP